jgi:carbonic anhydrase/acetyltransferase-like protein (isoleucine patch superfamily)
VAASVATASSEIKPRAAPAHPWCGVARSVVSTHGSPAARSTLRGYHARMNPLRSYHGTTPQLGQRVYVDPAATVIGAVELGDDVSIWPGAVLRGDVHHIRVGARSNIQDGSIVHVTHDGPYSPGGSPCIIGMGVTIGHGAVVHACTIGDGCLIGMHATVLDGARIGNYGFVGAGSLLAPGKVVGVGELWVGNPARFVRKLSERQIEQLQYSANHYVRLKDEYLAAA